MSVLVAVTDSPEGIYSLSAAADEAALLSTDLIAVNLTLGKLDLTGLPADCKVTVVERVGREDRDPVTAVLDELDEFPDVSRIVIGIRKRSRVGKALLGSVSQRLLLTSPVPVLAVKAP
ncbi:universal stress protein [Rhodococcus sp. BP-252]|uniref:universal stress protein n=1 Tax=unclassified Rhodococcus (in: high G+C Gram-positive bacteria) TaxID=192944 RepID=UPI001C9B9857|nr:MULTISPECIES: universal stress protein [unclassified Rhodococcus (in: high G+C Gram-positive bacteria)]MBY6411049.1 universal stress protein [Rhodococcus sp. BP-320]MBY6415708.1 universal stress protein [Rhodococcus sp. BP-321]MBY6420910.1 universal stress protein [Rhodococcus sp. BP-324]MBY6425965.1 universal stress protein [Rhodococcus sp. BP-323]MBY6430914.1 universal stress protein [Rhodococcus sp. BP-322]